MKYLPLIWAGLWRKPARTLLTFLSIVVAFLLFGMLRGVDSAFDRASSASSGSIECSWTRASANRCRTATRRRSSV